MERRKILLGGGTVLATVLAGCTGSGADDESESNDDEPGNESQSNDDDSESTDGGPSDDSTGDDREVDDVPGFDADEFDFDSDLVTVVEVTHDGDVVEVTASTSVTEYEDLYAELETIAADFDYSIEDLETFANEIVTIECIIDRDDRTLASFTIDVQWIVDYIENDLSKEDVLEKIKERTE